MGKILYGIIQTILICVYISVCYNRGLFFHSSVVILVAALCPWVCIFTSFCFSGFMEISFWPFVFPVAFLCIFLCFILTSFWPLNILVVVISISVDWWFLFPGGVETGPEDMWNEKRARVGL